MNNTLELAKEICRRLLITDNEQILCVERILANTIALSHYRVSERKDDLKKEMIEKLVALLSGFVSEIKEISDKPEKYNEKMEEIRLLINEKLEAPSGLSAH